MTDDNETFNMYFDRDARVMKVVEMRLDRGGFTGLFYPGECACERSNLAPCGEYRHDKGGFINGCKPGFKHLDPRPEHSKFFDFGVFEHKEPPTAEQWDELSYN
jgi:hypothetical protein